MWSLSGHYILLCLTILIAFCGKFKRFSIVSLISLSFFMLQNLHTENDLYSKVNMILISPTGDLRFVKSRRMIYIDQSNIKLKKKARNLKCGMRRAEACYYSRPWSRSFDIEGALILTALTRCSFYIVRYIEDFIGKRPGQIFLYNCFGVIKNVSYLMKK